MGRAERKGLGGGGKLLLTKGKKLKGLQKTRNPERKKLSLEPS